MFEKFKSPFCQEIYRLDELSLLLSEQTYTYQKINRRYIQDI